MQRKQEQAFERHQHTLEFLRKWSFDTGPVGRLTRELEQCVARLAKRWTEQMVLMKYLRPGRSTAAQKRQLRREHMLGIARVARVELKGISGVEALVRVPSARATTAEVIAAAHAMAKAAEARKAAFRLALEPGFVGRLRAATRDLEQKEKETGRAAERLTRATLEVKRDIERARALKLAIEGLLIPKFDADSSLQAEWTSVTRIGARRGRPRKKRVRQPS
jgi:hypothetical protein